MIDNLRLPAAAPAALTAPAAPVAPVAPVALVAIVAIVALAVPASAQQAAPADGPPTFDPAAFAGMHWREVGPYRGGRSAACTGIPGDRDTYYHGACGGGVWKTTDGGETWANVSDGFFGGSIGAVAVSEWDPNVVYAGGGEVTVRGNVSSGDGVWRSEDAGKTWSHVGLGDSRHVPRIRIHPRDPDLVYVAALGHLSGPNEERGLFRSQDGGGTWEKILYVSDEVGCVDLAMDPTNPRVLYACFWRMIRTPYSLESGGQGSGIWKSTDGGDSWTEITRNSGLPEGTLGISGISVSPSNPENVYAIVEAADGGVFRSRDAGETWGLVNSDRSLRQRAWYYTRIYADPADEETLYVLNVGFHRSEDGGRTFERISVPHGDNHDMWIDPADPLRMIEANDGGANVSYDGTQTWSTQENQPTAQMYRVSTDNDFPYRLLGGQQDNSTVRIPSRNIDGGPIDRSVWSSTAGGESGHVVAKPDDPDVVFGGSYGGFLTMRNHRTGERRNIHVWPDNPMGHGAADLKFRFQWNFPIFTSPHDPDALYVAAQVLFKSTDMGSSWQQISPDLTRDEKPMQGPSGGPITKDNTSVEYYCTIFAGFESPHEPGVIWCGSDDGLIHLTRDGGASWTNVTPPAMREWSMVNCLDPDPFEPGGCYVAATRYKLDDFEPSLWRTVDYGTTWERIDSGIPRDQFTRAIRADSERPGLLYAGTERGVHVSFDDGASWSSLQLDLPLVPVTDLAVVQGDLVAATQGRGYWILDDLSPLRQFDPQLHAGRSVLFQPRPAYLLPGGGRFRGGGGPAGQNPPAGVILYYILENLENLENLEEGSEVRLDVLEEGGGLVRSFVPEGGESGEAGEDATTVGGLPAEAGLNRFAWDLTYPGAADFPDMILWAGGMGGPRAVPGRYRARLSVGEGTAEVTFEVLPDPRSSASVEDLRAQFDFLIEVRDQLSAAHTAIRDLRAARGDLADLEGRIGDASGAERLKELIAEARRVMSEVERALYQTKNESRQDPLNFPIRLTDELAGLKGVVSTGAFAPTAQAVAVKDELVAAIRAQLSELARVRGELLPAINALALELAVPAVGGGN